MRHVDSLEISTQPADASCAPLLRALLHRLQVVFPEMTRLFKDAPPSAWVRASMSVPGFFWPLRLEVDTAAKAEWKDLANYEGDLPGEAVFVDGGLVSNFPISLFDSEGVPMLPTVGCQLGVQRGQEGSKPLDVGDPIGVYKAMSNTSRNISDWEYLRELCRISWGVE